MYSSRFDIHKIKNPSNDLLGKHKEKNLINPTIKINDKNQYISKLYEKLNTSRKYYFNLYFSAEISLVMGGLGDAKKNHLVLCQINLLKECIVNTFYIIK